jgi:hypothetical protein
MIAKQFLELRERRVRDAPILDDDDRITLPTIVHGPHELVRQRIALDVEVVVIDA